MLTHSFSFMLYTFIPAHPLLQACLAMPLIYAGYIAFSYKILHMHTDQLLLCSYIL